MGWKTTPGTAWWFTCRSVKQLDRDREATFGYNGFGWRFTGARWVWSCGAGGADRAADQPSTLVGAIAGVLLICDGVSFRHRADRAADGFLAFVVAAFGALIVDRDQFANGCNIALLAGRSATVRLRGVRCGGSAPGCCWDWLAPPRSGVYFVPFFGAMALAFGGATSVPSAKTVAVTARRDVRFSGMRWG